MSPSPGGKKVLNFGKKCHWVCQGGFPTSWFGDSMLMISFVELEGVNRWGDLFPVVFAKETPDDGCSRISRRADPI